MFRLQSLQHVIFLNIQDRKQLPNIFSKIFCRFLVFFDDDGELGRIFSPPSQDSIFMHQNFKSANDFRHRFQKL